MTQDRSFGDGRYTVIRELGRGGQKVVYLVHDRVLDRECALSLIEEAIQPESIARLRHEAQALARMGTHPNIVTVHDMGEEQGHPYVVSEHVAGGDLAQEIERTKGPLPLARVLRLMQDILRALAFIHERGIIHRDLKPSNVWIASDGSAKLGDFGLALAPDRSRLTLSNTVTGTPGYVSPEQLENHPIDGRSDLYSLGCLLFELLTGRTPFLGTVVAVISQHLHAAPSQPSKLNPEVPQELEQLALSMLAKSPQDRPASARDALEVLERLSEPKASTTAKMPMPMPMAASQPLAPPKRHGGLIAFAAVACVLALAGLLLFKQDRDPESPRRVVILPTRDVGMTVDSTVAWALASRLVEVVDRYQEFRPISHAGVLSARLGLLGGADSVPDETLAREVAKKVAADTVAALSIAMVGDDEISVAIHVFDTDDPSSGVASPRERLKRADLDADGPRNLGQRLGTALARQWRRPSLTDEANGMAEREMPFDAFQEYLVAGQYCMVGRFDQCEMMMRRALEKDPTNVAFHSLMTCALSYQGRDQEADEHGRLSVQHLDDVPSRNHRLHVKGSLLWVEAERLRRMGDTAGMRAKANEMLAAYREMYEVHLDPWGYLYSGAALGYFLEDYKGARTMYALAREKGPMFYPPYYEDAKLVRGDGKSESNNLEAAKLLWTFIECNPSSDSISLARTHVAEWQLPKPADLMPCPRLAEK